MLFNYVIWGKMKMNTFYIGGASNWILRYISDDIVKELKRRGLQVRSGSFEDYQGETIAFQMWWRLAQPYSDAQHNSVFITHTDDITKEKDLIKMRDQFDSYICMSEEDAQFLIELGYDPNKVFGLTLPTRNSFIRPISIGIFSNCYPDNRKNERWLLDYCSSHEDARLLNFVFLGNGWENVCSELASSNCSFEWHCASRSLPGEYFFQQLKLSNLDYYLYMGMDGGAMGTYDAYAMGIPLCVSDDGYHKSIPDVDRLFETKDELFHHLDEICSKQKRKLKFFENHSIECYVNKLMDIWSGNVIKGECLTEDIISNNFSSIKEKRRANYYPLTFSRWRQPLSSLIHKWIYAKQLRKNQGGK